MQLRLPLLSLALLALLVSTCKAVVVHPDGYGYAYLCSFNRDNLQVTCGGITCTATKPGWFSGSVLPAGMYRIGPLNTDKSVTWYNLYPKSGGSYWDYYSGVPALSCRAGFALHGGSYSKGCITVTDDSCLDQLADYLNQFSSAYFTAKECSACTGPNCLWGKCWCGEGTVQRRYIGHLSVYN